MRTMQGSEEKEKSGTRTTKESQKFFTSESALVLSKY